MARACAHALARIPTSGHAGSLLSPMPPASSSQVGGWVRPFCCCMASPLAQAWEGYAGLLFMCSCQPFTCLAPSCLHALLASLSTGVQALHAHSTEQTPPSTSPWPAATRCGQAQCFLGAPSTLRCTLSLLCWHCATAAPQVICPFCPFHPAAHGPTEGRGGEGGSAVDQRLCWVLSWHAHCNLVACHSEHPPTSAHGCSHHHHHKCATD